VSDYFGALMRSSGLSIGGRASERPRQRTVSAASAPPPAESPSSGAFADIVELDGEYDATAVRNEHIDGDTRPTRLAIDRARIREDIPPAAAAAMGEEHAESANSASGEPLDLAHLQRAAIDAALRWVTADPGARVQQTAAEDAADRTDARAELSRALDRHDTSVFQRTTALVAEGTSARDAHASVLMAEIDIGSPERDQPARDEAENSSDRPAAAPVEDVVEVSIGAIHVHVDGPPARPQVSPATPRRGNEARGRSAGSGLERRYLRAI
jgi:hypothetical protein